MELQSFKNFNWVGRILFTNSYVQTKIRHLQFLSEKKSDQTFNNSLTLFLTDLVTWHTMRGLIPPSPGRNSVKDPYKFRARYFVDWTCQLSMFQESRLLQNTVLLQWIGWSNANMEGQLYTYWVFKEFCFHLQNFGQKDYINNGFDVY